MFSNFDCFIKVLVREHRDFFVEMCIRDSYKEKDEQRPDYGKYKFYVQMGDTKMSAVASREDLNAYFISQYAFIFVSRSLLPV